MQSISSFHVSGLALKYSPCLQMKAIQWARYFVTYWPWLLIIAALTLLGAFLYVFGTPNLSKSRRKWWFYAVVTIVLAVSARGSIGLKPLKNF